jgi:hypothetical protein
VLSESSYLTAIYIYTGAAGLMLLYLTWWLSRSWSPGWAALLVLLAAALLLTPAYPRTDVNTMAPALIVAGFQYFTEGYEAAEHALKPLGFMCGLAAGIALLLRLTLLKGRSSRKMKNAQAAPES